MELRKWNHKKTITTTVIAVVIVVGVFALIQTGKLSFNSHSVTPAQDQQAILLFKSNMAEINAFKENLHIKPDIKTSDWFNKLTPDQKKQLAIQLTQDLNLPQNQDLLMAYNGNYAMNASAGIACLDAVASYSAFIDFINSNTREPLTKQEIAVGMQLLKEMRGACDNRNLALAN